MRFVTRCGYFVLTEVAEVERLPDDEFSDRTARGVRERPRCERCGRTVRVRAEDYEHAEILCPGCASDAKAARLRDPDFDGSI